MIAEKPWWQGRRLSVANACICTREAVTCGLVLRLCLVKMFRDTGKFFSTGFLGSEGNLSSALGKFCGNFTYLAAHPINDALAVGFGIPRGLSAALRAPLLV
jgi:hypothetical protein